MKLLICDDDTMTIRALEFQFKRDGFEVFKAHSGREAQTILTENEDIDLLITDIYMPSMNGMELITFVRNDLKRNIPILVLSRANVEDTSQLAFDLKANEYLTKPVNLEDLSYKVKQLLEK